MIENRGKKGEGRKRHKNRLWSSRIGGLLKKGKGKKQTKREGGGQTYYTCGQISRPVWLADMQSRLAAYLSRAATPTRALEGLSLSAASLLVACSLPARRSRQANHGPSCAMCALTCMKQGRTNPAAITFAGTMYVYA